MTRFIQLHLLVPYAAANLNRDDTGRPKTLMFGGAERLRISSQSLKRAFRTSEVFANGLSGALGMRSQHFMRSLIESLIERGLAREDAIARAEAVIEHDHLGKVKVKDKDKDKGKGAAMTEQLVHLGPDELARISALAERLANSAALDERTMLVLRNKPRAADIAMFGRMLTDNPGFNVEAAVQVAHAFTTHRATVEDDYFTVADDFKNADQDADQGAGFVGVQEFGAGLFYLYICVDADLLLANLAGDHRLAADTVAALIRAATTVSPTGKQNAFASRAKSRYALLEIGEDSPRSLAAAFQHAVGGAQRDTGDQFEDSVRRLVELRDGFARAYGETLRSIEMKVDDSTSATLSDLIAEARAVFAA